MTTQRGDHGVNIEDGKEYMVACKEAGTAANLRGKDLDAWVRDYMDDLVSGRESSIGQNIELGRCKQCHYRN